MRKLTTFVVKGEKRVPLRKFEEQFKKSSFIIQEQGSRTGHELLLKCSRTAQVHFMNVKFDNFLRTIVLKITVPEKFKKVLFLKSSKMYCS